MPKKKDDQDGKRVQDVDFAPLQDVHCAIPSVFVDREPPAIAELPEGHAVFVRENGDGVEKLSVYVNANGKMLRGSIGLGRFS